jgi:arylsulfatase
MFDHVFLIVPAQAYVGDFLKSFVEYPPRQKAASFSLERVMERLEQAASGAA